MSTDSKGMVLHIAIAIGLTGNALAKGHQLAQRQPKDPAFHKCQYRRDGQCRNAQKQIGDCQVQEEHIGYGHPPTNTADQHPIAH